MTSMPMDFKEYLSTVGQTGTDQAFGATFQSAAATGTETPDQHRLFKPGIDIGLPTLSKTATITKLMDKYNNTKGQEKIPKSSVLMMLDDGTKLYIPYSAFNKIPGEPAVGKRVTVVFQRRPEDLTGNFSQVASITVF